MIEFFTGYLPSLDTMVFWLEQYGSIAIFILLALGIIALPVPEETLMIFAGVLIRKEVLSLPTTFLAAFLGSVCGITVSYIIGRTGGYYLIHKYGGYFGFTEERQQKMHVWFEKIGKWSIFFCYFIPGVRHFMGVIAGATVLEYPIFALFAYTGALFWVSTFIFSGYFFGDVGGRILEHIDVEFEQILIVIAVLCLIYFFFRFRKSKHS